MKKIFLIIVLISGCIIAQSWNNIVTTTINEANLVQLDNFTNRDGIHVVAQNSNFTNSIKYYRLNSSGGVQTTTTIETSGGAEFPHIAGDNEHMFISYRLGNNIVTKKYIYANGTWESQSPISLNNHDCNSVDNAYNDVGLHIVFSEFDGSDSYKTHYYLYASFYPSNHYVVNESEDGLGWPTISLSSNKAHVGFHSNGYVRTRDKNLTNNSWESTQGVAIADGNERVQSGCDKLFDFYDVLVPGIFVNLYVKERGINSSTWSSPQLLNYSVHPYLEGRVTSTVTSDGKTYIIYDSEQIIHRSYNCATSSWSDEYEVTSSPGLTQSSSISAVSNDLYIVFREYGGSNIKYGQYDAIPLAPANYSVSAYQSGTNYYPRLTWSLNNEPDVRGNSTDAYKIERRTRPLNGTWSSWSELANLSGTTSSYIDYSINNAGSGDREAEYRITAIDLGNNSSPAQSVTIEYGMYIQDKVKVSGMVRDYSLDQNYPNPFNPSTKISYSIKEEGLVTLKVYDVLGKVVTTLVNENKAEGNYEVDFNASELPSGMYIYKIQAGQFSDVKKMILTK